MGGVSRASDTTISIQQKRQSELICHVMSHDVLTPSQALRKMLQSDGPVAAATGTHSVARGNTFSQLLQDMVQSTVASIRTVSRLAEMETGGGELDGVRMRLESQLEEAEEVDVY